MKKILISVLTVFGLTACNGGGNSASNGNSAQNNLNHPKPILADGGLSYQITPSVAAGSTTGIGSYYTLIISNNSTNPINLAALQFTARSDAGMEDELQNLTQVNLSGGQITKVTTSTQSCYGVNNSVCDIQYNLTLAGYSGSVVLAPGASITFSQLPNSSSVATGVSTKLGISKYNDVAHNITLIDESGNQYLVPSHSIYSNLANPNPNKYIGGYFANWTNYQTAGRMFPVESAGANSFPVPYLNHVTYDLGYNDPASGAVAMSDSWADSTYLQEFAYLRAMHPWLNIALSFGGWGSGVGLTGFPSQNLQSIFETNNPKLIQQLADNMVNTAILYGFNGVDIDYEWGGMCNVSASWCQNGALVLDASSVSGYQTLIADLATDIKLVNSQSQFTTYPFILTTALFAGVDKMLQFTNLGGDFDQILSNVTSANLMAYDFHGQFDVPGVSDVNGGLYRSTYQYSSAAQYYDVNDALYCGTSNVSCGQYKGYAAYSPNNYRKINLGIPSYSRVETLSNPSTTVTNALYQPLASNQNWVGMGGGVVSYRCIENTNYCNQSKGDYLPGVLSQADIASWNTSASAMTPWFYYIVNGSPYFGSFDNGQSVANKVNYIENNQLNGGFLWEIDEDIPMTDPNYTANSLIYNLGLITG